MDWRKGHQVISVFIISILCCSYGKYVPKDSDNYIRGYEYTYNFKDDRHKVRPLYETDVNYEMGRDDLHVIRNSKRKLLSPLRRLKESNKMPLKNDKSLKNIKDLSEDLNTRSKDFTLSSLEAYNHGSYDFKPSVNSIKNLVGKTYEYESPCVNCFGESPKYENSYSKLRPTVMFAKNKDNLKQDSYQEGVMSDQILMSTESSIDAYGNSYVSETVKGEKNRDSKNSGILENANKIKIVGKKKKDNLFYNTLEDGKVFKPIRMKHKIRKENFENPSKYPTPKDGNVEISHGEENKKTSHDTNEFNFSGRGKASMDQTLKSISDANDETLNYGLKNVKTVKENVNFLKLHKPNIDKQADSSLNECTKKKHSVLDKYEDEAKDDFCLNDNSQSEAVSKYFEEIETDGHILRGLRGNEFIEDKLNDLNIEIDDIQSSGVPEDFEDDRFRTLSLLGSNLFPLMFNPNAKDHNLKRCKTRSNENGYCMYIQNCQVPNIATSLEQLLNNACVIDEVFIGVCCPEFPVETVKVHWDSFEKDSSKKETNDFVLKDDCGTTSDEAFIMQSWPWQAPLFTSSGKFFCGGVVINEEYILTAAHCTTKIPKNRILVRLGQFDESSGEDFAVVEIKRHAQYSPGGILQNDIALLKLHKRAVFGKYINKVCLPEDDGETYVGNNAILNGIFSKDSFHSEVLKVLPNEVCHKKLKTDVPHTSLCTETRKKYERNCNEDSGSPLLIDDGKSYKIIGVLSWNRHDCDQRFPSTFTRVSSYRGWIQKHAF